MRLPTFCMGSLRNITCAILLCCISGCASAHQAPIDPSQVIDVEDGYRQGGQVLDSKSLTAQLKRESEAKQYVNRSENLGVAANLFAAAGGGLIGWPLGTHLGGGDPNWTFAYVGGGCIAAAIPLLVLSVTSYRSAVDAHNLTVSKRVDSARLESTTGWFKEPGVLYSF